MAIDCHAHFYPPSYIEYMRRLEDEPGEVGARARFTINHPIAAQDSIFFGDLDERIALMDAGGVDVHVLSWSAPNIWHPTPRTRAELVRAFNDGCLEVAQQHPGRFKHFANVPLPHVEEALAETQRLADHPEVVGIGICSYVDDTAIDDPRFAPVFEDWNARGLSVFLHPDGFCKPNVLNDYLMEVAIGMPFDDTIVTTRLIYSGMISRYPNINWIVPHLGGAFPMLLGRLDFLWRTSAFFSNVTSSSPVDLLNTVYFDIVAHDPAAIRYVADRIGVERLVLGSDFPYASRHDLGEGPRALAEAGLNPTEIQAVLQGNIAPHLGMTSISPPN